MSKDAKHAAQSSPTLGFPHLERLVEQDNFDELNRVFLSTYDRLEAIQKGKTDAARKRAAQKAMRALELTMNLLREFLQVKEEMLRQGTLQKGPGSKK